MSLLNAKKAGIPFGMTGQAPTEVRFEEDPKVKEEGHSDFLSRGLSYHSRPGKHYRCDRAPIFLRIGSECDDVRRNEK